MRYLSWKKWAGIGLLIVILLAMLGSAACAPKAPPPPPPPPPKVYTSTLSVDPASTVLGAGMLSVPINFTGSGWAPGEGVVVELMGARPGYKLGENIPVANGQADASGNIKIAMDTTVKLTDILCVEFKNNSPDFTTAKPIAARTYAARASGLVSGATATTTFTLTAPAPAPPK